LQSKENTEQFYNIAMCGMFRCITAAN